MKEYNEMESKILEELKMNEANVRIEELIDALKFYANANNYERPFLYSVEIPSNIKRDQGELARLILCRHNEAFNGKVFETCDSVGFETTDPVIETFESEIEYLKAMVKKFDMEFLQFENVLKFYANPKNYIIGKTVVNNIVDDEGYPKEGFSIHTNTSASAVDAGRLAREALDKK